MADVLADPLVLAASMGFVAGMSFGMTVAIAMAMYFSSKLW